MLHAQVQSAADGPTEKDLGDEGVIAKPTTISVSGDGFTWGDWRFPTPVLKRRPPVRLVSNGAGPGQ